MLRIGSERSRLSHYRRILHAGVGFKWGEFRAPRKHIYRVMQKHESPSRRAFADPRIHWTREDYARSLRTRVYIRKIAANGTAVPLRETLTDMLKAVRANRDIEGNFTLCFFNAINETTINKLMGVFNYRFTEGFNRSLDVLIFLLVNISNEHLKLQ